MDAAKGSACLWQSVYLAVVPVCVCVYGVHAQVGCWLEMQTGSAAATCMGGGWKDPQGGRVHPAELRHPGKRNPEVWRTWLVR